MSRILLIDIETAPNIAYVWGAWKQNIGYNQWKQKSHIMSFAAKWLDEKDIIYEENRKSNDRAIVSKIFKLLDKADIVVAHNGRKFDLPTIIGRGLVHGYSPPSPYFIVDTLDVAKREFRFTNNSLAVLTQDLGIRKKDEHKKFPGFELWLECLRGNDEAWEEMKSYNIDDVLSLEELYLRLRPFIRNHPNIIRHEGDGVFCPKCGSNHIQYRGYYYTRAGLCYKRFQCMKCGGWGRDRFSERDRNINDGRNAT